MTPHPNCRAVQPYTPCVDQGKPVCHLNSSLGSHGGPDGGSTKCPWPHQVCASCMASAGGQAWELLSDYADRSDKAHPLRASHLPAGAWATGAQETASWVCPSTERKQTLHEVPSVPGTRCALAPRATCGSRGGIRLLPGSWSYHSPSALASSQLPLSVSAPLLVLPGALTRVTLHALHW